MTASMECTMHSMKRSMRTIREVLRLQWHCGLSERDIAASCHISATAARGYIHRAKNAGLSWPLPDTLHDEQLEPMLFPPPHKIAVRDRPLLDCPEMRKQLARKGVTL